MQEPVLVLNATFEPINVTAVRRALGATERRLIQQWLTEAGLLALLTRVADEIARLCRAIDRDLVRVHNHSHALS